MLGMLGGGTFSNPQRPAAQFGNGVSFRQDRHRSAARIADCRVLVVDSQVVINRCREVANADTPVDDVLAQPIGASNHLAGGHSAAAEQERGGVRPVVAAWL